MPEPRFEMETHLVVYDNENGQKVCVRPDADGLGLLEVDGGQDFGRMCFPVELAQLVAMAMAQVAATLIYPKAPTNG